MSIATAPTARVSRALVAEGARIVKSARRKASEAMWAEAKWLAANLPTDAELIEIAESAGVSIRSLEKHRDMALNIPARIVKPGVPVEVYERLSEMIDTPEERARLFATKPAAEWSEPAMTKAIREYRFENDIRPADASRAPILHMQNVPDNLLRRVMDELGGSHAEAVEAIRHSIARMTAGSVVQTWQKKHG